MSADAERRPWGLWASLVWYLLVFEVAGWLYEYVLGVTGWQAALDRTYPGHALGILLAWGLNFLIILIAVWLTRIPVADYLGWTRPRLRDVAIGVAVVVAAYAAFCVFLWSVGAASGAVEDYRAAIAKGTSRWWFVLQWWPTLILSPFVEESFFRGFLWRGVQAQYGNSIAFLVSTVLFAAMHYSYWMSDGVVSWSSVVQYLVSSAVFGWLRWRSGGTIVPMIAHALDNAGLRLSQVVLSALMP
jgi:membrane protease YdiL (CAAX protease family)